MKNALNFIVLILMILFLLPLTGCFKEKGNVVDFVNNSNTSMLYKLTDDNFTKLYAEYPSDLPVKIDFDGGYEYSSYDGYERYVFTTIPSISDKPVMSYMHCTVQDYRSFFGIMLGETTVVKKNDTLKIPQDYNLWSYLEDNGFKPNFNYIKQNHWHYVEKTPYLWSYYIKDNVFVNFSVDQSKYKNLYSFEIGIVDDSVNKVLERDIQGYSFILDDPFGIVTNETNTNYKVGDSITIKTRRPLIEGKVSLYINDNYVTDFTSIGNNYDEYLASFEMPAYPITVKVVVKPLN